MKLLFMSGSFPYMKDGVADAACRLYEHFVKLTDQVFLITTNSVEIKRRIEELMIEHVHSMNDWKLSLKNLRLIRQYIVEHRIDCIHLEYPGKGYGYHLLLNFLPLYLRCFKRTRSIPIYMRYHEFSQSRLLRKLVDIPLLLGVDKIFTPSYHDYKLLSRFFKRKMNKTYIGSNIRTIPAEPVPRTDNTIQLGYFGFIYKNKGLETLIIIFHRLLQRMPDVRLTIIGEFNPERNAYHRELLDMAKRMGVDQKIFFTGYVENEDEVSKWIRSIDIAVLPFDDGLTLRRGSFLTFLLQGIPIVTTQGDAECVKLFANDRRVYMCSSIDEAVQRLTTLCNRDTLKEIEQYPNEWRSFFSWDRIAADMIGIYHEAHKRRDQIVRDQPATEIQMFQIRIDNLTFEEAGERISRMIEERSAGYVVTPNVDHIIKLQKDQEFRQVYDKADLVLTDGMPLVWASRMLGKKIKEKISGSDLLPYLCELAARKGYRIFLLGAGPGIAATAAERLVERYPGLQIAGTYSPSYGFEHNEEENRKIVEMLSQSNTDILFVGVGAPKQEKWIFQHYKSYNIPVSIGVGAAFDFESGHIKRAPKLFQRIGMEWFWRFCQEPRRLFRRYFIDDVQFVWLLIKEIRAYYLGKKSTEKTRGKGLGG